MHMNAIKETARIPGSSAGTWGKASRLALAGGAAFWVANVAISLTPIAAEYRAALAIPYLPMLLEALLGGLILGLCVSYPLLRISEKLPTMRPVRTSMLLSLIALIMVTMFIEVPAKLLTPTSDAWRYFLIGAGFNVLRILALGLAIGYRYERLTGGVRS
jgi:hypothetical protein